MKKHARQGVCVMDIPKSNYAVSYEGMFLCSTAATARLVYNIRNEETDIPFFFLYIKSPQKAGQELKVARQKRKNYR